MSSQSLGTAASKSLIACHSCGKLNPTGGKGHCTRCDAHLHMRKPMSIQRTWALLISAAILYIPANTLPVMTMIISGKGEPHTVLGGAIELFEAGSWSSGFLVVFASVTVPCFKILGLFYLLLSVHFKSLWRPRDRTVMYRVIELVGRWSMIDIFMVSILAALVNLGALALVEPGPGATYFAAVVILTMLAAMSFDPRLIWDHMEKADGR
jgi:paraquat-inducible protein A